MPPPMSEEMPVERGHVQERPNVIIRELARADERRPQPVIQ